jgi:protein required for attachment to host cells
MWSMVGTGLALHTKTQQEAEEPMQPSNQSNTTWIVVGHRAGVHIFTKDASNPELQSHRIWDHPEGRLRAGDLTDDRRGMTSDSSSTGQRSMEAPVDPTEHVAQSFANEVAAYLDHARHEGQFSQLVLIAGPRFLGILRGQLSDPVRATVIGSVSKNLQEATPSDISSHIREFIVA